MAKKEEIYPEGYPRQKESFSDEQKFKFDVFEAIREIALETTEKAFEDKGYKKQEGAAGEYGTGEKYGAGTSLAHFNIRLSSRPNTNTYFEKIIYFGGKKAISDITIGWDAKNKTIELAYKTSEFSAFRGYHDKMSYDGAQLINDRSNFVIDSMSEFKKELKKLFKEFADREVAYITSTKIGIEDKTNKSINSMVENSMKKFSLKNLMTSSDEDLSNFVQESIFSKLEVPAHSGKEVSEDDFIIYTSDDVNSSNDADMDTVGDFMDKYGMSIGAIEKFNWGGTYNGIVIHGTYKNWKDASNSLKKIISGRPSMNENKNKKEDKVRMNNPEVVAANSPGKLLFDDIEEIKDEKTKTAAKNKLKKFGVVAINELKPSEKKTYFDELAEELSIKEATVSGGNAAGASYLGPKMFKPGGDLNLEEKEKFEKTPYAQGQKAKPSVHKTMKEGDTFWTKVELNPGSGYVPKGMQHNYEMGAHSKNTDKNYPGKAKKMNEGTDKKEDSSMLKESLVKRKFASLVENEEKGINKRYIVTEQRTKEEEESRWKKLAMFETYETINHEDNIIEECGCADIESSNDHEVTMDMGQDENEREFMQRNSDAEVGSDNVDGKEVIVVAKPGSLSNAMFKVFKDDYLNESKAYIKDLNSGNLVANPNFKVKK